MRFACLGLSVLVALGAGAPRARAQADLLQTHIGHILEGFKDTPKQQGLLPTALDEAKIAAEHAALALKSRDNLDQMKLHAAHVIHALDPTVEPKGPGIGYGVKKAELGVQQHVELAAKVDGASTTAKNQALYVSRWAANVVKWSDEAIELAQEIRKTTSASAAGGAATELVTVTEQLLSGMPAVGRFDPQGGLKQAQERMELMKKGP
jgi:hypothetical protein